MLQDRYPREQLPEMLLPPSQWRPFPPAADREAWEALQSHDLNRRRTAHVVGRAEAIGDDVWPTLPATQYMTYIRDGRRGPYEGPYFRRRGALADLVVAECFEYRGRFVDQIINLMWAVCEESTWCVPAHIGHLLDPDDLDPLGRLDREIVDLFAAETAMVLAEACYLLGDELDEQTRILRQRVIREIIRRIIDPVMRQGDFWWLTAPMNWNPWCSSNVLGAGFYVLDDPDQVADLTWKLMGSTDAFLAGQLADGGCSEGPNYWGVAPGALVILLELLHSRSQGRIDIYDEPLIANLGLYLPRVHLDGPWFATFADCPPVVGVSRAKVYRYGERIGDASMCNLSLLQMRRWDPAGEVDPPLQGSGCGGSLTGYLRELFWVPADATAAEADLPLDTWLGDLQVMVARQSPQPGRGFVLAAKAGHNSEYHNHNDVGQFILVADGEPMVVDVGMETYTRKTFGPRRYEIWCTRGSGHNAPLVNGAEQAAGAEFAATDVAHETTEDVSRMTMDLAGAYPPEAAPATLTRSVRLDRAAATLTLTDSWKCSEGDARMEVNLFTPAEVEFEADGVLTMTGKHASVQVQYDPAVLTVEVGERPIDDKRLRIAWGGGLTRLTFKTVDAAGSGKYSLTFAMP